VRVLIIQKVDPLYVQIYEKLKEEIVKGEFKPREQIVDSWIAKKLSVSRSPVREAFRKLEQDGLIVNKNGTTSIYEPNLEDVTELFQVRAGLEQEAAYLAAELITNDQLDELSNSLLLVEKAIKEKRVADIIKLNTFFHEFIITISSNKRLIKFMGEVNTLTLLYRNNAFKEDYIIGFDNDVFLNEHHEILEALKNHDADRVSKKMRNHILHDLGHLKERYSNSMVE